MNNKLLTTALVGGVLLFFLNLVFLFLDVYWVLPWTDLPMHFFGGFFVALIPLSLKYPKSKTHVRRAGIILAVLSVSILWEWYENLLGLSKPLAISLYDTVIDVGAALLGGVAAFLTIVKK